MAPPPTGKHNPAGGYSCQQDSLNLFLTGAAFTIIAIMAGPLGILAEVAFWSGVATYGGVGTAAWATVHFKQCDLK